MLNFVLFLLVLMTVVSLITALVIEAVKKIVSEDSLKKTFKSLEIFSLVFTFIIATITYLCFLLFANLQIDLSALTKCKTIGSYFLFSTIITSLDLRNLTSLESIGTNFLHNCNKLSEIWLPQRTPPTLVRWGDGMTAITKIHCGSYLNQYKSASVWSNYSSLMVE